MAMRELTRTKKASASSKVTISSEKPFNPRHDLTALEIQGEADAKAWAATPEGKASLARSAALVKHFRKD